MLAAPVLQEKADLGTTEIAKNARDFPKKDNSGELAR